MNNLLSQLLKFHHIVWPVKILTDIGYKTLEYVILC